MARGVKRRDGETVGHANSVMTFLIGKARRPVGKGGADVRYRAFSGAGVRQSWCVRASCRVGVGTETRGAENHREKQSRIITRSECNVAFLGKYCLPPQKLAHTPKSHEDAGVSGQNMCDLGGRDEAGLACRVFGMLEGGRQVGR